MSNIIQTKTPEDCNDFFKYHRHQYALDTLLQNYSIIVYLIYI